VKNPGCLGFVGGRKFAVGHPDLFDEGLKPGGEHFALL